MSNPVQRPLPEGVHDSFTYHCTDCGGTITVVESTTQPHACKGTEQRDDLAVTLSDAYEVFYEPMDWHESTRIAAAILAAGYRKGPNEEDVERAAEAVYNLDGRAGAWETRDEEIRELYREDARAVIAVLTGGRRSMIPNVAIEAAAKVLRAQDDTLTYPYPVAEYMGEAKALLEAAAPHLMAQAWDEGAEAEFDRYKFDPRPTNPYRSQE